jgi:hypothetical protein
MTELQLYKFVTNNDLEYHWIETEMDFYLFIPIYLLKEWNELLGESIMDDSGITCVMKNSYFCFEMSDICEYFDIDMANIFEKD